MNLLKTLAYKVILLLMIAINMLKLLKALLPISMLIFVEYLDLVNRVTTRKIIVSTTGMKKPESGTRLLMSLVKRFVSFILLFVNFAMKRVILIINALAIIMSSPIQ
jgi:hypothetical protein